MPQPFCAPRRLPCACFAACLDSCTGPCCRTSWPVHACLQVVSGDGWWKAASLDAAACSSSGDNGSAAAPLLEFVVTDGFDSWDKAPTGGNYTIQEAGCWQLADGVLAQAERPPVLLVSDLDDTMIGDDDATAAFTRWWQEEAVPAGGRLVFNTGRVSERELGWRDAVCQG